ncbi:hypothetical protein BDV93DRAFT_520269 [Ceratobasidium sp. AG-I]|nr:hypothetical protein BDV93DRAFT_520269 [Ceratobasidium sp. AG-I]
MRTSFALLALAAVVSAGSMGKRQFPSCAMDCITRADTGTCDATDNTCLCNSPAFVDSTYSCIASTCTGEDLQTAVDGAKALCAAAGVSLTQTLPAATESATEVASETASAEPSSTEPAASGSASASATGSAASQSRTSATSRASGASTAASGTASASASASATQAANSALGLASSPMLGAFAAVAGLVFAL